MNTGGAVCFGGLIERQKITTASAADEDVIALAQEATESCVEIFHVRDGKVVARDHYLLDAEESEPVGDTAR